MGHNRGGKRPCQNFANPKGYMGNGINDLNQSAFLCRCRSLLSEFTKGKRYDDRGAGLQHRYKQDGSCIQQPAVRSLHRRRVRVLRQELLGLSGPWKERWSLSKQWMQDKISIRNVCVCLHGKNQYPMVRGVLGRRRSDDILHFMQISRGLCF
jgi:hypothetical protein